MPELFGLIMKQFLARKNISMSHFVSGYNESIVQGGSERGLKYDSDSCSKFEFDVNGKRFFVIVSFARFEKK